MTVVSYGPAAAAAKFTATEGNAVVAGLDLSMKVNVTNEGATTGTDVTQFTNNKVVIVTTKIEGGHEDIVLKCGSETWSRVSTEAEVDEHGEFYYNSTTDTTATGYGKLVFATNHFSEFKIEIPAVAQIVETGATYGTLKDAVAAVAEGNTIKLLKDSEGCGITTGVNGSQTTGKGFTLDFNGHTYSAKKAGAGSSGTKTSAFQLLPSSSGKVVTLKNGTINCVVSNIDSAKFT